MSSQTRTATGCRSLCYHWKSPPPGGCAVPPTTHPFYKVGCPIVVGPQHASYRATAKFAPLRLSPKSAGTNTKPFCSGCLHKTLRGIRLPHSAPFHKRQRPEIGLPIFARMWTVPVLWITGCRSSKVREKRLSTEPLDNSDGSNG